MDPVEQAGANRTPAAPRTTLSDLDRIDAACVALIHAARTEAHVNRELDAVIRACGAASLLLPVTPPEGRRSMADLDRVHDDLPHHPQGWSGDGIPAETEAERQWKKQQRPTAIERARGAGLLGEPAMAERQPHPATGIASERGISDAG